MSMQLLAMIELFPTRTLGAFCVAFGVACVAVAVGCILSEQLQRWASGLMAKFLALSPLNKAVLVLALAVSTVCAQKSGTNEVERLVGGGQPNQESNLLCSPSTSCFDYSTQTVTPADIARGWQVWEVRTNETDFAMPENVVRNEDWFRFGGHSMFDFVGFGEGWTFPYGTQELALVTAMEDGGLRVKLSRTEDEIRAVPCPLAALPRQSQFGHTTNGPGRVFAWQGFFSGGDTGAVVNAQVELRANGDFVTRSNAVETLCRRIEPFDYDGDGIPNDRDERPYFYDGDCYGQSEAWVRANFTNAEEILSVGYPQWVDAQVGVGLENGLYKLTATFAEVPRRTTLLTVGDISVCVTNAGEYVFLLEKGVEYEFGTVPYDGTVEYAMQDDVAPFAPLLMSTWGGWSENGEWTIDGGWSWLNYPSPISCGICGWMPTLRGSPDIEHLGQEDFPITFEAVLTDCCRTNGIEYRWTTLDESLRIVTPRARTTTIAAEGLPSWRELSLNVTATLDGQSLCSMLWASLGRNRSPQVSVDVQGARHVWVNHPVTNGNKRAFSVCIKADVPTNGTFSVEYGGSAAHANVMQTSPWRFDVHEVNTQSVDAPYMREFAVVEGIAPSESCGEEYFAWRFDLPDGSAIVGTNRFTVVKVGSVDLWSEKGGASPNPPPFPGQEQAIFRLNRSPNPDRHYPVFFHNVVDTDFCVQPYSVEYQVVTLPSDFVVTGGRTSLELLDGPASGTLRGAEGKTAYYDTPSEGGVYKVAVRYADSPPTETILVLPMAGASVDNVVALDLERANAAVGFITNHYSLARRQDPTFGLTWFNDDGMGDYRGRVNCADKPTVWCYNQVNDESGLGAVATFNGLPVRMAKMSNFLVGYATTRMGVSASRRWFAQAIGRFNDATATMSWNAGVSLASGAPYEEAVVTLSTAMWPLSDEKERMLWPNLAVQTNHTSWRRIVNFNYSFISPGFTERTPNEN